MFLKKRWSLLLLKHRRQTAKFQFVGLLIDRRHLVLYVLVVSENILKNKDYLHKPFGLTIRMAIFLPFFG